MANRGRQSPRRRCAGFQANSKAARCQATARNDDRPLNGTRGWDVVGWPIYRNHTRRAPPTGNLGAQQTIEREFCEPNRIELCQTMGVDKSALALRVSYRIHDCSVPCKRVK